VTIRYKGKQAKAKVIDRGPYVAGREFDLTEALRNKLGFPGVGTIWVDK
jgi:rare lipoprotein A (peptidoglycan hydrolase)